GDIFALCLAIEELARVDSSVAITLEAAVALGAMPLYRFGREDQRRRWPPELCAGERLAPFALAEPGGGRDVPGGVRPAGGPGGGRAWGGTRGSGSSTARRRSLPTRARRSPRW